MIIVSLRNRIIECIDKFDLKNGQISYFFFLNVTKFFLSLEISEIRQLFVLICS